MNTSSKSGTKMARPGKMEVSVLLGSILAGALSSVDDRSQGVLAGIAFLAMFTLIVGVANVGFLSRHRRAPVFACVVAPFTTGVTLLLLGSWPDVRKV